MKKTILISCFLWLAGCVTPPTPVKPESGEQVVGDRLTVTLDGSWNHIYIPGQAAEHWTMEGLPIDDLQVYSGIKDGQTIQPVVRGSSATPAVFHSTMQPDEIVSLFESMLTRDGSTFQLVKSEPATFGGARGYHFEFKVVRKVDSVELSGVGYGAVSSGELFAIVYVAPRMTFFGRYQARVDGIAQGARIRAVEKGPG